MSDTLKKLYELADGCEIYIVGGYVRDRLLQRANKDLDLATPQSPEALAKKAARKLNGSFVRLDEENKIYRVVLKDNPDFDYLDFAMFKGKDLRKDLSLRDFTINSMALPLPASGEIDLSTLIDPFAGKADMKKKTVRMTSKSAFTDDPLRLMRAFRFAGTLGYKLDPATKTQIKKNAPLIATIAAERVREELLKLFALENSAAWVRELERSGLLDVIIPEIGAMKKSARSFYFHPLGLWQHAMETLVSLEETLGDLSFFPKHQDLVVEHLQEALSFGTDRKGLLKLIALLHDVAKPACAQKVGDRMRFLGHDEKGAEMAAEILRRLRMSNREIRIAQVLIANHMRPINLGQAQVLTERAVFRFFRDIGNDVPDLLLLALSDMHSYRKLNSDITANLPQQEKTIKTLMTRFFDEKLKPVRPQLLNGNTIMKKLKLKPGRIIGDLISAVNEAQALGKISTTEEALAFATKELTPLKKRYKIK